MVRQHRGVGWGHRSGRGGEFIFTVDSFFDQSILVEYDVYLFMARVKTR